MHTTWYISLVS